ncbi:MAG: hypothetical protein K8H88_05030 [Sandaracinaceae bacterium]|nr:hypothetical protein [Sandaracinaceae bacterium]
MRQGILRINQEHRALLSNDLGAAGALLFDVGSGRYPMPPATEDPAAHAAWEADLGRVREEAAAERKRRDQQQSADVTHTRVQAWLRDLGLSLGFDVWIAANDRSRPHEGRALADRCLDELPPAVARLAGADTIRLIDVIWLDRVAGEVRAAFEVEHTTSIYSGIVRLLDLALSDLAGAPKGLFIVAPDDREQEVRAQLARPAFRRVADLQVRYLPYGELDKHREAMGRFGQGLKPIEAVARSLA